MKSQWLFIISGILAGSFLPVQAGLNAMLGQTGSTRKDRQLA